MCAHPSGSSEHPMCTTCPYEAWDRHKDLVRCRKGCVATYGCFFQAVQQVVMLAFN